MIGKKFHDFEILEFLGSGNVGKVYLATQKSLGRQVAIKIIEQSSQVSLNSKERFFREARLNAALQHENIVTVYSAGEYENFLYIAMEYVRGKTLDQVLEEVELLPEIFVLNMMQQVVKGLACALEKDIIHRDIKPSNLMVTETDLKITDFGLSKKDSEHDLTIAGTIVGTPNYMSPEQTTANKVDFRSDIYSLGATTYCLLTKHLLFSSSSVIDVMIKHRSEKPLSPLVYNPDIKTSTVNIIAKMLHKDPNNRYASYQDLLTDISLSLEGKEPSFATDEDACNCYTSTDSDLDIDADTSTSQTGTTSLRSSQIINPYSTQKISKKKTNKTLRRAYSTDMTLKKNR